MNINDKLAHSANDSGHIESLPYHLETVAEAASSLLQEIDPDYGQIGHELGMHHDLGKANPQFQERLMQNVKKIGIDHKCAGAKMFLDAGLRELAYCVYGHHSVLENGKVMEEKIKHPDWTYPDQLPSNYKNQFAAVRQKYGTYTAPELQMLIRMFLSSLVDADRLLTAKHFEKPATLDRYFWNDPKITISYGPQQASENIRLGREEIKQKCAQYHAAPKGIYDLTAPTGGGKTLTSLEWAVNHARHNGLKRLIYVMPFLALTDQNAQVTKACLKTSILVHTSRSEDHDEDQGYVSRKNWNAPVVITTFVQFFESLFSNKSSKIRKLHNIANSVIIIDEFQALPFHLRNSTFTVLKILQKHYGCSILLMTATPPTYPDYVTRIIPEADLAALWEKFKRYEWEYRGYVELKTLAQEVSTLQRALVVFNTVKDAQVFTMMLRNSYGCSAHCLSTHMTHGDRKKVLEHVKDEQCILVSTQCIEAGVDISFPVLYRALAPLESIIQAAGRCNRNGAGEGRVIIFKTFSHVNDEYKIASIEAERFLRRLKENGLSLEDADSYKQYTQALEARFQQELNCLDELMRVDNSEWPFRDIAFVYKMIKEDSFPVYINNEEVRSTLRRSKLWQWEWKKLERNEISLSASKLSKIKYTKVEAHEMVFFILDEGEYDPLLGVVTSDVKNQIRNVTNGS